MARARIPDPLERRHLIERDLPPAHSQRIADEYLEQGRDLEAAEFLQKAGAEERLAEMRERAVQSGDAFLLRGIARITGVAPGRDEWAALAEAAAAAGKDRYAEDARRQAERGEG